MIESLAGLAALDLIGTVPDFVREAQSILRDGSMFQWSSVTLLALVLYVYSVEIERRRWDIVLAGLALLLMDQFNELINSAIFHVGGRAPLWTVTGDTSFLIYIGFSLEILFMFAIAGIIFVKLLPADRKMKILGLPNRLFLALAFSIFCVIVEILLVATGYFHWDYWWWNTPFIPLIVIFGYGTFFLVAAWVYDMGSDRSRQIRVVAAMAGIDLALGIAFGLAGWL